MSKQPTVFKCRDNTYMISDWDVDKALEHMMWITKTFGKSILNIFITGDALALLDKIDGIKPEEGEEEIPQSRIEEFFENLVDKLDPKEYVQRSKSIIAGTLCGAREIDFNTHFRGKMGELHKLMFEILKHQYSDFLAGEDGDQSQ